MEEVLSFINARHKTTFRLIEPLTGGYQEGAWKIIDASNRVAVLKLTRATRAAPVVCLLRAAGYPTPDFLFWGITPNGTDYLVQEFAPGVPLQTLTLEAVEQLVAFNRLQSGLARKLEQSEGNWSAYAHHIVFADESGWASSLRAYSRETADLMQQIDRAAAPFADDPLPINDAVHGDWNTSNFLTEAGRITAVVDCGAAGYGSRAVDLAGLLHYAYADECEPNSGPAIRALLREEILTIGGMPLLSVLLLYRVIALVEFQMRFHHATGVTRFVHVGRTILSDLA